MLPDNLPPAPPATGSDDPLDFDPVPRRVNRPDGWTPDRQREFIRRLAVHGSPQQACIEMGKNVTGIEAVYKVPSAHSFRAAWDHAVQVGRHAQGLDGGPLHLGPVPGIKRRNPRDYSPPTRGRGRWPQPEYEDEEEVDEETRFALLDNLFRKFLLKVQAERTARLAGQVVAADFYLRQITFVEIALDLMAEGLGLTGWQALADLRRGGHNIFHLAETDMSRLLDSKRRALWAMMAEPDRPEHPPVRYLVPQSARRSNGDAEPTRETISLEPQQCLGRASAPPPGVDAEAWSAMDPDEQKLVLNGHYEAEAEAQIAHEASASAP